MYKEFIKKCLDDLKRDKKTYCVDITQIESLKNEYRGILKYEYIKDLRMFLVEVEDEIEGEMNNDECFRWLNEIANKQLSKYVRKVRSNDLSDCYIDISTINKYFNNTLIFKIYQEDMVYGGRYLKCFRNDTLIFVATADYGTDKGISYYIDEFDESIMVDDLEYDEINYLIRLMKHQIRINVDVEVEEIMVEVKDND